MKNTLASAKHEIIALRRQNEILRAKVEVMDLFAVVLHTKPAYPDQCASVDVVWEIEQEIAAIELREASKGTGAVAPAPEQSNDQGHRSTAWEGQP